MKNNLSKQIGKTLSQTLALAILLCLFSGAGAYANNIAASNIQLLTRNTSAGVDNVANYRMVQFDLSWENSWRTSSAPNNWDAAWVFIKYRVAGGAWQHASLNNSGHTAPGGNTISIGLLTPGTAFNATTNPGMGALIYRSADGTGTFTETGVQLRWNYGANGIADASGVDILVYAVEMVYVPTGTFSVGSGGTETGSFTDGSWTSGATIPFSISSENEIAIANSAGNLWYTSTSSDVGDRTGPIPAAFPKGYAAFYCMKYEISQQQYVDFLNSLTRTQQAQRVGATVTAGTTSVSYRYVMSNLSTRSKKNGIRCDATIHTSNPIVFYCDYTGNGTGGESGDGQSIACNFINWADVGAYLDWSALRPMTELEFEKACRGTATPVANEYAWGTAGISGSGNAYTYSNEGYSNEVIATKYQTTVGNALHFNTYANTGPVRVGVFAGTSGNTGRVTAGATYYGIMEMTGNLYECPVTVGNSTGRGFTGAHGNGSLSSSGYADVSNWPTIPLYVSPYIVSSAGSRGGSYGDYANTHGTVSTRNYASYVEWIPTQPQRMGTYGGRGVRLAP